MCGSHLTERQVAELGVAQSVKALCCGLWMSPTDRIRTVPVATVAGS